MARENIKNKTRQSFKEAPEEKVFIVCDGKRLKSIRELSDVLGDMSEQVFASHVNSAKNDFANWVRDVFGEQALAEELFRSSTKTETQLALLSYLVKKLSER